MARLPIIQSEEGSPEAQVVFEHSTQMFGRVANAVRVANHSPKLAQSLFGFIVASLREEIMILIILNDKNCIIYI